MTETTSTLRSMNEFATRAARGHKHTAVTRQALRQRAGVPYQVERTVCERCGRVLGERPLRRTAA
jgi:NMD protein affecting ribosome stability and mRNA decay